VAAPTTHGSADGSTGVLIVAVFTALFAVAGGACFVYADSGAAFVAMHIAIGSFAVYLLATNRTRPPLSVLTDAARRVADGELDVHVAFGGRRDLVSLADAFNSMTDSLRERTEALTHTVEELSTPHEMSRTLGSTLDLETMLDPTLDAAMHSFAVDSGYVVLRDPESGEVELRAWCGTGDRPVDGRAVRASMSEWVVRQGRPLVFNPSREVDAIENVDAVTGALAAAVDAKEPYMRDHSGRVAVFARATAEKMGLSHDQCTAIEMAAHLHDIGRIGISEQILRKPGPLSEDEMSAMRHHPLIGANILRPVTFPWSIAPVVRHHHEHFDGTGYPAGLRGDEIPLLARVLSVADAYEAMTANRPYRDRLLVDGSIAELRRCSGTDFDLRVVEAPIEVLTEMDAADSGSEFSALTVEPYEARAVFVAVADGMLSAYRKLGGPRLTANLEVKMSEWLAAEVPAFGLSDGHFTVARGRRPN